MKQSEDFYKMGNYEDKIYSLSETVTGQIQTMSQAVQKTLENNGGVGIMTGYYDQNRESGMFWVSLWIASVSLRCSMM